MSTVPAPVIPTPPDAAPRPRSPRPRGPLARRGTWVLHLHIRDVGVFGLFVAIFAAALKPVVDNDVFWHLATGRYIWATAAVPHTDPFSWTAYGRAWIAHEWLTETWLYPLYAHGGYAALILVFAAVITAAFAVSYATARLLGASRLIAVAVTGLAAVASMHTWGVRPQMLSLLLIAVAAWLLTWAIVAGRRRALWLLPPLMVLWVNLHGGFIFGLALIGIFALGQTCEALWSPHSPLPRQVGEKGHPAGSKVGSHLWEGGLAAPWTGREDIRQMWAVFAASVAACLINPNGLKGLIYPFTYLGNNASTRYIAEWVSPDFHQTQYQFFEALILALIAGAALSARRPRLTEVLLALLFTYLGLDAVRNINLFSIVVAPLIALYLSSAWWRVRRRAADVENAGENAGEADEQGSARITSLAPRVAAAKPRVAPARAMLNLLLAVFIAGTVIIISLPGLTQQHNVAMQARRFPAGAVAYLRAHHPAGRLFNSYDWGGYLIWTLYPRMRVYVDGRPDMYGDRFMDQFVRTWQAQSGWQATLRRGQVRLVLVEPTSGIGRALAGARGWRRIYHDKLSVLYERTD